MLEPAFSPLMGAVYLSALDEAMDASGLLYARFMDDWVVLSPTRWKLKQATRKVNQVLCSLKVSQHPDKTFIGRIEKGFDFLGYHLRPHQIRVAEKTMQRFVQRAVQLYEQEPGKAEASSRLGMYVKRWIQWARSGLGPCDYSKG